MTEERVLLDLRQKMAQMGYFGIRIPEEYGGLGLGCLEAQPAGSR
jgi:acyl-CoA dehydrogenase